MPMSANWKYFQVAFNGRFGSTSPGDPLNTFYMLTLGLAVQKKAVKPNSDIPPNKAAIT